MNKITNYIKTLKEKQEKEKEKQLLEQKLNIINLLKSKWTKEEIHSCSMKLMSGWINKDYSEQECKLYILRNNFDFFTPSEYQELQNSILSSIKSNNLK